MKIDSIIIVALLVVIILLTDNLFIYLSAIAAQIHVIMQEIIRIVREEE